MSYARPNIEVVDTLGYVIVDMTLGSCAIVGGVYYETRKDANDVADALDNPALNVCAVLVPEEYPRERATAPTIYNFKR